MAGFNGFTRESVTFFQDLSANNTKLWFDENRDLYDRDVIEPARDLIQALGEGLRKSCPGLHADPRVNRSLFRINRDTRFSKDKTPYKTHLGLWMWEGDGKRMACPGFYFHLEPGRLMLGGGMYVFPKPLLEEYRLSAVHLKHGPALAKAVAAVQAHDDMTVGVKHYKKTPREFDPDHKNAEYLLFNGLIARTDMKIPRELYSKDLVPFCLERYKKMLPIHRWLLDMIKRVG